MASLTPSEPRRQRRSGNFGDDNNDQRNVSGSPNRKSNFRNNRGRGRGRGSNFSPNCKSGQQQGDSQNRGRGHFRGRGRGTWDRGSCEPGRQRPEPFIMRPVELVCTKFMRGRCYEENEGKCRLGHFVKTVRTTRCKYWIMKQCLNGDDCSFSHNVPCKYFHLYNGCIDKFGCVYSHEPMTELERKIFIKDLNLDLPPKILFHDFNTPHGKSGGNHTEPNPLSLTIQVPKEDNSQLPEIPFSTTTSSVQESDKRRGQFSLSGFYKDTLDSDEDVEPAGGNNFDTESTPEVPTTLSDTSQVQGIDTELIDGKYDPDVQWDPRPVASVDPVDYYDIRKAVLIGFTLVDPRLTIVPKLRKPKSMEEFEVLFPDVMTSLSSTDTTAESPESP